MDWGVPHKCLGVSTPLNLTDPWRNFPSMESPLPFSSYENPEPGPDAVFNVMIAYEDFETGKQAKQTYDFVVANLGSENECANQMWKFDVLSILKLHELAVKDAAAADIVIISCRDGELPDYVRSWFDAWLGGPHRALALVALIETRTEFVDQRRSLRDYLTQAARRGGMEFFIHPDENYGRRRQADRLTFQRHMPKLKTLSVLAGALERENRYARWSLRE